MAMSSPAVTNFALNFDENVRWAMCLRLKPDVLAAIQAAGPDASNIRFAVEGDRHAIEVGDKKFVLDCREEKTGATICEAHKDWSRGEVTEVGVAKLRGDVQTTFSEKQMLATSKRNQSGTDLHERIVDASCTRIPPERKIPSSASTHNRNTVIVPMKTLLPAGSSLRSPPVQASQERHTDSRGASPARAGRQTPPKLLEANGEEVLKATLEEVARVAASHGKLRFCVMALLSARNFRVRRKLGQDVITLFREGRHDKVPSESTVEMAINKVSQMSAWGIVLTEQARAELLETVLQQFRTGSWTAVSTPIGSPAEGTVSRPPAGNSVRGCGSKLNPQNAVPVPVAPVHKRASEGKEGKKAEGEGGKRKAQDSQSAHKHKKHKHSSKKDGDRVREHDGSKHKDRGNEGAHGERKVDGKGAVATGGRAAEGGKRAHKDETREEKKVRKESRRDEKKAGKRDRERGADGKKERRPEAAEHQDGDKKRKVDKITGSAAASNASNQARFSNEERVDKLPEKRPVKPVGVESPRGTNGAAAAPRHASPADTAAAENSGGPKAAAGLGAHSTQRDAVDVPKEAAGACTPSGGTGGKHGHRRSASPAAGEQGALQGADERDAEGADVGKDAVAKLSSPFPPKVVPPKVAVELLEADGKSPAWLEAADEGPLEGDVDVEGAAAEGIEHGAAGDDSRQVDDATGAAVDALGGAAAAHLQHQAEDVRRGTARHDDADDDDDDFSVGGDAGPPARGRHNAGHGVVGGIKGTDSDFAPMDDAQADAEPPLDPREGRSGTPDGASEHGEGADEDEGKDGTGACLDAERACSEPRRLSPAGVGGAGAAAAAVGSSEVGGATGHSDGVLLNAEEVAEYLESVSQGNGQLCLDREQLERDFRVYVWLRGELQRQTAVLQRVPESAATGVEVVSQHAEALREFDATHAVWFQKSKLMSLLYHRLLDAKTTVRHVTAEQHRRQGLVG